MRHFRSLASLVLVVLICAAPVRAADGNGVDAGKGVGGGQRLATAEQRIDTAVQRIEGALAKHPNAPAEVKTAAEKLTTDLTQLKQKLENVKGQFAANGKAGLTGLRGDFQTFRQTLRTDREALRTAVQNAIAQHKRAN